MTDCLKNLGKCNAECCRVFALSNPSVIGDFIILRETNPERQAYYSLHGGTLDGGRVLFFLPDYEVRVVGNKYFLRRDCNWLTKELTCAHHEDKPFPCKDFGPGRTKGYFVPPNCLFGGGE